jgi:hypothetical protein
MKDKATCPVVAVLGLTVVEEPSVEQPVVQR